MSFQRFKQWIFSSLCESPCHPVGINTLKYMTLEKTNGFARWLDGLLFTQEQRYQREEERILVLLAAGAEEDADSLAEMYLKQYGYSSYSLGFDHGMGCFIPNLRDQLAMMVEKGKLLKREQKVNQPAMLVGPERAHRIVSQYALAVA